MIVCPNCRHLNDEEVAACASCGQSLEPGPSLMLPMRRSGEGLPQLDIKPPPTASPWRAVGLLVVVLAIVGGFFAWKLTKPDPCRGLDFRSDLFGYCVNVPQGWSAQPAQVGGSVNLDQFSPATQSTVVLVEAHDLTNDMGLQQFADLVRQQDQAAGLKPGPAQLVTIDGVDAQEWDITAAPTGAGGSYQEREVVIVRGQVGWRAQLNSPQDRFQEDAGVFQQLLESWRFA